MALKKNKNVILTPKAEGSRSKYPVLCLAAAAMFLLAACGDEVTEVTEVTHVVGMQIVEEGDALPKCTTENEGEIVYSVDSAAAYYCVNRTWTSMKGKDGVDGKNGKDGENGKDGKNGTDGKNGKDGKNGADGMSCSAVVIDKGYKIVCGDDSVGVVLNGAKGDKGADGKDGKSFVDGWMVDSRDKQLYRVVTIGEQTWMAENLNYKVESSYCYNDSVEYCEKYGRLYKWAAAVGKSEEECGWGVVCGLSGRVRGVCPEGWHMPDKTEWNTLFDAVGGKEIVSKVLRSQTGWNEGGGTDDFGFSALPAGGRYSVGFNEEGIIAGFWSATEANGDRYFAYHIVLSNNDLTTNLDDDRDKLIAYSVRCIKD